MLSKPVLIRNRFAYQQKRESSIKHRLPRLWQTRSMAISRPELMPVLLGTDVGTYSCARMFHEAFGCTSVSVSGMSRGSISHSNIIDPVYVGRGGTLNDQLMIETLEKIADTDRTPIIMPFMDRDVDLVLNYRDRLEKAGYVIPLAPTETVERASDKAVINAICKERGLPTITTVPVPLDTDAGTWPGLLESITFPAVIKPRDGGMDYGKLQFPGQRKAYDAPDLDSAMKTLAKIQDAGFAGVMLVQDMVVGDDTQSWIVTGYVDSRGTITAIATGRQILGLHQSSFIGNAGIIHVTDHPELRRIAGEMIDALGLRGFFSIDIKIDSRTNMPHVLDVNPRWGRGSYYSVVGGVNLARAMVADFIDDIALPPIVAEKEGVYAFVPPVTVLRWVRDKDLRRHLVKLMLKRRPVHPLSYSKDPNFKRFAYRYAADFNQLKALIQNYPTPTETTF